MNFLRLITLVCVLSAFICATGATAQADASAQARDIINLLTRRSSLPSVEGASRLNAVSPEVARALGERLTQLDESRAERFVLLMRESINSNVHAALLIPLAENANPELSARCVSTILSMDFIRIVELRDSLKVIHPTIAASLKDSGRWNEIINSCVLELMNERENRYIRNTELLHRESSLALLADIFLGDSGFPIILNSLLDHMVGVKSDDDTEREAKEAEERANAEDRKEEGDAPAPVSVDDAMLKREKALAAARRRRAMSMFRRVFLYDPERFQFATAPYELRKTRRAEFFERIKTDIYANDGPQDSSWLSHVNWVMRYGDEDERMRAMVLADELSGRVRIPIPEAEKAEAIRKIEEAKKMADEAMGEVDGEVKPAPAEAGEDINLGTVPEDVPIFDGSNEAAKINNFKRLDKRDGQRPRIRALRTAFEAFIKRVRGI